MSPKLSGYILNHIENLTLPDELVTAKKRIENEYKHFNKLVNQDSPPNIYAVNTLVGHMDSQRLTLQDISEFQNHLIENHALKVSSEFYDNYTSRCISYTRAWFYSQGGGGISSELYNLLLSAIQDGKFNPEIPSDLSYSSGDVIPGANWAKYLMNYLKRNHQYKIKPKEGISLINGAFVHVGSALSTIPTLLLSWHAFMEFSKINAEICKANSSNFTTHLTDNREDYIAEICNYFSDRVNYNNHSSVQDPVSLRTLPQNASAFFVSVRNYLKSIDISLQRKSDNPLVIENENQVFSQGSFVNPEISLSAGQLIDSILMISWVIERRIHYTLSGKIDSIPINFSQTKKDLGFIQIPKMATAILENMRYYSSRRTFASGSTTSYGTEDFWSLGLYNSTILKKCFNDLNRLLSIEGAIYGSIAQKSYKKIAKQYQILNEISEKDLNNSQKIQKKIDNYYIINPTPVKP